MMIKIIYHWHIYELIVTWILIWAGSFIIDKKIYKDIEGGEG